MPVQQEKKYIPIYVKIFTIVCFVPSINVHYKNCIKEKLKNCIQSDGF